MLEKGDPDLYGPRGDEMLPEAPSYVTTWFVKEMVMEWNS